LDRVYTANTTIYAQWTEIPVNSDTVTWNRDGGTPAPTQTTVAEGGSITTPAAMTKTGYTFGGWYANSTLTMAVTFPVTGVTANREYWAKWTPESYTITYTLGGGTVATANPTSYTIESAAITLNNPTRTGYTFAGWTGSNGTTAQATVTIPAGSTGNKSYTATWTEIPVIGDGKGTFTDSRGGGTTYKYVTIGGQVWMAENLNYEPSSGNSWCYDNCNQYGRLYDWATAMDMSMSYNSTKWNGSDVNHRGVCPIGWHLPSNAEWTTLVVYAGGSSMAGTKLKATSGWGSSSSNNGTDDYGFSALPGGGYHYVKGSFLNVDISGSWQTSTDFANDSAYARGMTYDYSGSYVNSDGLKRHGISVRCVRDD
jgi:uncharacterized protein (TIGR02145 family)/uncharacterized repeat protein (TIGR02543 family)